MSFETQKFNERLADLNALGSAMGMMEWDQQTYMPRGGAEARANHLEALSRMHHELFTSEETQELLVKATAVAETEIEKANVRIVARQMALQTKLPSELVAAKTKLAAVAHEEWVAAKAANRFSAFSDTLEKMFDIVKEEANYLGYVEHPYDALTDQYEEGATAADWVRMYESIKGPQVELVKQIQACPMPDDSFLTGEWDNAKQAQFAEKVIGAIGFDFERGRQDTAPHPFCGGWSVSDVRLTNRYRPYLGSSIFGGLHEAGHGMYEQGSPLEFDRLPVCGGVSLGVHESQSRTWENIVGRSRGFWAHFLPSLKQTFPAIGDVSVDQMFRAVNKVQTSFIRVEADELTYNLHTLVRFEIECDVLTDKLKVKDLPEAWNAKYEQYLGVRPKTDTEGCLQDVHWSQGSIGYFPTYSMGNILSYQIWNSLQKDVPNTEELIASGQFAPILDWLKAKIYSKGSLLTPKALILEATGEPMNAKYYLDGLSAKYKSLYSL